MLNWLPSANCATSLWVRSRITTGEYAAQAILWPALRAFLPRCPDIKIENIVDCGLADIVSERYDAGVRLGEQVAKDMITVRIGPDMRMAVVGALSYFASRPKPKTPDDLTSHACINLRLPTYDGLYVWEFEKKCRELKVRVDDQLVFNNTALRLNAVLAGFGLAYLPEEVVQEYFDDERLLRVLEDCCPPFSGCHLYYPSRRQHAPAFALFIEALRYRQKDRQSPAPGEGNSGLLGTDKSGTGPGLCEDVIQIGISAAFA